ncbi:MAG: alanine racemase [Synergistaceae bacterium]|nr:alanine racemase [Synergistaceae bacterium]
MGTRYPVMIVNRKKVLDNVRKVNDICSRKNIEVWGVTKGLAGDPRLAEIYEEGGLAGVSDSRLANLIKIRNSACGIPRQLMRIAMHSEIEDIPAAADVSLQSEVSSILKLDKVCDSRGIAHRVLLMVDVGDLREGFWPNELTRAGSMLSELKRVSIVGVAANFACASGLLPSREKFDDLIIYRDELRDVLGIDLPCISIGGTCCLKQIEEGGVPGEINQLRMSEGVLLGKDTAFMRDIPYLDKTAIVISAEVVECRKKPSVPDGEIGCQAFGEKPLFIDRGMRKRAILGIGRQDLNVDRVTPLMEGVHIVTASSDHLIIDVTEADSLLPEDKRIKVGDTLDFRPLYPAMLAAATSEYVRVEFE